MGSFADQVSQWVAKTKAESDQVVSAIALSLTTRIVMMSPVGNPELWKANAEAALMRYQHNEVVDRINQYLMSDPANLTPKGNLKRSVRSKSNRRLSKAELKEMYPLKAGKGYVGGRFRGSWTVTIGAPSTVEPGRIDPHGSETIEAAKAALSGFKSGPSIYITSNVPYAVPLEYGHSSQAPNGMVRVTVAEFQSVVSEAIGSVSSS
jgi:hypothetical protein